MKLRANAVCVLAVMTVVVTELALSIPAESEHTRFWRQSEYSEFQRGTAKGVAIRSDGSLTPAPHFASFADPNLAYLWTLRLDSHGKLYAAGGSNAKVLRFDEKGSPTTVFESTELAAQSILFDAHDNLYVGTSPDGKIYKVTAAGQKSVFYDPKTKYIWALAMDSNGILFAATGDQGQVYAIGPDGNGKLFYKSDERHARSLAFDAKGNLLIGTDPSGLILRVEIERKKAGEIEAGHSFVIYETDKKEVTSLIAGNRWKYLRRGDRRKIEDDALRAAGDSASGRAGRSSGRRATWHRYFRVLVPRHQSRFLSFANLGGGSEVYRIAADGSPESTLEFARRSGLLAGIFEGRAAASGHRKSWHGDRAGRKSPVFHRCKRVVGSSHIVGCRRGRRALRGNRKSGKNIRARSGREKDGSYESVPFDAKIFLAMGAIVLVRRKRREQRQAGVLCSFRKYFATGKKLERLVRALLERGSGQGKLPRGAFRAMESCVLADGWRSDSRDFVGESCVLAKKCGAGD